MEKIKFIFYSWYEYIRANRIVGVFLISLAILICVVAYIATRNTADSSTDRSGITTALTGESAHGRTVALIIYSAIISLLLLFPITALVFMQFQTVFYTYSALWLMVPIIPVSALVLTILYTELPALTKKRYCIFALLFTTATLLICGGMGSTSWKKKQFIRTQHPITYDECRPLLSRLDQYAVSNTYGEAFTILAPYNITAYAHMYSGNIHTLYGKDMWDNSMMPYTYNEYPEDYNKLCIWINCIEVYGTTYNIDDQTPCRYNDIDIDEFEAAIARDEALGGILYTNMAKENGVDVIVMYTDGITFDTDELSYITDTLNLKQEYIPINDTVGYILLFL